MHDTTELLEFAKALARDAGKIMLEYFDTDDMGVEVKQDASPVTLADKRINQLVIDRVEAKFPTHGILAEEGSSHTDRNELWVCDPIDGTKSFILHIPTALFSLAYVVDGKPEVAVMYDPFQGKLYSAARGQGAYCNDRAVHVSEHAETKGSSIGITSGYRSLKKSLAFFDELLAQGAGQIMVPGNVFKSALVTAGDLDAHIFPGKSAHDVAAAKLIVEEAGGKVTDLHGQEQRYDQPIYGAIISNGLIHDDLVKLVQEFGPENYIGY